MIVRAAALLTGLGCYGLSMAMMVRAELGLDPWDVLHQGLARHTSMTIGVASAVVGAVVLLAWIPLRNKPGVGTVANVAVIAVTVDAVLAVLPAPHTLTVRVPLVVAAIVLNAVATVLYVGAGLGPGPRDGLMTGLVARSGLSVRLVRTSIEATVLAGGWLLGGSVGAGTVLYALGIGPLVQLVLRITPRSVLARSGWATILAAPTVMSDPPGKLATCSKRRRHCPRPTASTRTCSPPIWPTHSAESSPPSCRAGSCGCA